MGFWSAVDDGLRTVLNSVGEVRGVSSVGKTCLHSSRERYPGWTFLSFSRSVNMGSHNFSKTVLRLRRKPAEEESKGEGRSFAASALSATACVNQSSAEVFESPPCLSIDMATSIAHAVAALILPLIVLKCPSSTGFVDLWL